jgi:signal transduction histidine kinase
VTQDLRDRIALAIAAVCIALSLLALAIGRVEIGVKLVRDGDRVVVEAVTDGSLAARDGVQPGMVVLQLNGTQLIRLPEYVYPPYDEANPDAAQEPSGIEPAEPTPVPIGAAALDALVAQPVVYFDAITPWGLETGAPDRWEAWGYQYWGYGLGSTLLPLGVGVLILVVGLWLLASGRVGPTLQPLAVPLAVAVAAPFLVRPLEATWWAPAIVVAGTLVPLAMLPLAEGLLGLVERDDDRRMIGIGVVVCAAGAVLATVLAPRVDPWAQSAAYWLLAGAIPLMPGLAAAGPLNLGALPGAAAASSGRVLQSTEFAVAGATPLFAIATDRGPWLFPLSLWLAGIFVAGRFTIRPLARLVTRAQLQRDLVVAATEAERARVAADIHDDALQELTLLVRRLDAAGDTEGAELARGVSDRLRAICGDLRLPILDDLGVGPALDWLVLRIERLAGGEVRLERADGARPPADVELAFFRVAQEALSNAVRHGKPPIVVRYRSSAEGASLSIDDAGSGIDPAAGAEAEQAGRFGLLDMAQRAEQIGAILDVRRWPSGGTHVALEWRPR